MVGWNTKKINTKLLFKPFWIGSKPKLILKSFWMAMELERTMKTLCYWIIQHFTITTNYRWSYFGKECHWVAYVMQQQQKLLCKCHCSIFLQVLDHLPHSPFCNQSFKHMKMKLYVFWIHWLYFTDFW